MKIIGITGAAGSGKDTARSVLQNHFGVTGMAFADPMRAMLGQLLDHCGIGAEWMTQRELKELPMPGLGVSYRHAAQALGTEWGRALTPSSDIWLKAAAASMAEVMNIKGPDAVFCISDVRFDNEAQWVRNHGGVIWKISRQNLGPVRLHSSESGVDVDLVDLLVLNDDLQAFKQTIYDQALDQLEKWGAL